MIKITNLAENEFKKIGVAYAVFTDRLLLSYKNTIG